MLELNIQLTLLAREHVHSLQYKLIYNFTVFYVSHTQNAREKSLQSPNSLKKLNFSLVT